MRGEELKGHLDALLLAALEDGPRHGYAVIEALRESTGAAVISGALEGGPCPRPA
jgi:PadR family transcriptional regulator PadR